MVEAIVVRLAVVTAAYSNIWPLAVLSNSFSYQAIKEWRFSAWIFRYHVWYLSLCLFLMSFPFLLLLETLMEKLMLWQNQPSLRLLLIPSVECKLFLSNACCLIKKNSLLMSLFIACPLINNSETRILWLASLRTSG